MYTKCQERKGCQRRNHPVLSWPAYIYRSPWLQIVIATIAFGMRLDFPDIRYVSSGIIFWYWILPIVNGQRRGERDGYTYVSCYILLYILHWHRPQKLFDTNHRIWGHREYPRITTVQHRAMRFFLGWGRHEDMFNKWSFQGDGLDPF